MVENAVATPDVSTSVLTVIERAVMSPDVDVSKMEKLLDMQMMIMDREARNAFIRDFGLMQSEFPAIERRGKSHNGMFATFDDINSATTPARSKYGFALSFVPTTANGLITISATLSHHQGHTETASISLPAETSGSKNDVQAVGSTISYGMRFTIKSLLSVSTLDPDMDGYDIFTPLSDEEADQLAIFCKKHDLDAPRYFTYFTKYYKRPVASWGDLPAGSLDRAMKMMEDHVKNANN